MDNVLVLPNPRHSSCLSESNMRLASNISKENLVALGTCVGKFTKSGKFHLTIHCLDYLAQYAKVRSPPVQ